MIVSDVLQTRPWGGGTILRRVFIHRKLMLVLPAGIGAAIGYVGFLAAPPRYSSEAVLVLDARKIQALPTESVVSPLPQDSPVLRSELDIIASHIMAERVLQKLSPEAVELLREGNPSFSIRQLANQLMATSSSAAVPLLHPPSANTPTLEGNLLSNLRVSNDGRSYTIFISYSAGDASVAAEVANSFAQSYIDYQIDVQGSGTRQVSEWLGQKLVNMRASLENSERALAEFRESANLLEGGSPSFYERRVAEAEAELGAARTALSASQARLDIATRQLEATGDLALPEVSGNVLIQNLRTEQYRVERRMREIADSGATMSSELPGLKSQLGVIRQQIVATNEQVIETLTGDVDLARGKAASAEAALAATRRDLEAASKARVHEAQLEREATANRTIYESYLTRYKQTIEQEGIASPEARLISRAEASQTRTSPRLQNWLGAGLLLGASCGFAFALLREATDRHIRSAAWLVERTGYPVLGTVPYLSHRDRKHLAARPMTGRFLEAMLALYATVRQLQRDRCGSVIALTSYRQGEGKTTVAVSLARAISAAEARVLVIDCNFSRPALANHFPTSNSASSKAVPLGASGLESLIFEDEASGVSILTGLADTAPPGLLLARKDFRELLAKLRKRFDVIVLDGPALSQSLDAWQVAALADGVMVAVSKTRSKLDAIKSALEQLEEHSCNVMGLVINRYDGRAAFPRVRPSADIVRLIEPISGAPGIDPADNARPVVGA